MVTLKFKKLNSDIILPYKSTSLSGGMDVTASSVLIEKNNIAVVNLGLAMQPPKGYRIRFSPRSSFTKYNWVMQNTPALGDADYIEEYKLIFRAIPIGYNSTLDVMEYEEFPYKKGDRVAQMWLEEIIEVEFEEGELIKYDRKGGFGSTGK